MPSDEAQANQHSDLQSEEQRESCHDFFFDGLLCGGLVFRVYGMDFVDVEFGYDFFFVGWSL